MTAVLTLCNPRVPPIVLQNSAGTIALYWIISNRGITTIIDKLIFIGGFLGSGKTTLLAEAAKRLAEQEKVVGLITND